MFKYLFIIFLLADFKALPQSLPNIGFENGNFDNWVCEAGSITTDGILAMVPTPAINGRHTIIGAKDAQILDYWGQFPILCPNGSKYSIRLGNDLSGGRADRISYKFTVPASGEYTAIFDYAVLLQTGSVPAYQEPRFTIKVYDFTDAKYIDCPNFDLILGNNPPGFKQSLGKNGFLPVFYRDWSKAALDLHGYPNKVMQVEFTVNSSAPPNTGWFGYAYIDIEENSSSLITGNSYCLGQKSITLTGPNGYANYDWYTAGFGQELGQGQTLTISPPPPDQTTYILKVIPYEGLGGCGNFLYTTVNQINSGFKLAVPDTLVGCPGTLIDLTAPYVTTGTTPGTTFSYYSDPTGNNYQVNPNLIINAGTYYIQGTSPTGCTNILPVHVVFRTPNIVSTLIEPAAVNFPTTIDLSKTFKPEAGLIYSYYKNSNGTGPVTDYTAVKYGGIYYIKATNPISDCSITAPINITIIPPPPYTITAPNTFTPNNDGINDHFNFTIKGAVTFSSLKIFNRNGQLLFTEKSAGEYWDGNYKGKNLPAGVYYWVFDGLDEYNNVKINKAGSITLLR